MSNINLEIRWAAKLQRAAYQYFDELDRRRANGIQTMSNRPDPKLSRLKSEITAAFQNRPAENSPSKLAAEKAALDFMSAR